MIRKLHSVFRPLLKKLRRLRSPPKLSKMLTVIIHFPSGYREHHYKEYVPGMTSFVISRNSTAPENSLRRCYMRVLRNDGNLMTWTSFLESENLITFYLEVRD